MRWFPILLLIVGLALGFGCDRRKSSDGGAGPTTVYVRPTWTPAELRKKRVESATHISKMLQSLRIHAEEHDLRLPASLSGEDLKELVRKCGFDEQWLVNPVDPLLKPGYVYIRFGRMTDPTGVPNPVVLCEPIELWEDGGNIGYNDGAVSLIKDKSAFEAAVKESQDAAAKWAAATQRVRPPN